MNFVSSCRYLENENGWLFGLAKKKKKNVGGIILLTQTAHPWWLFIEP